MTAEEINLIINVAAFPAFLVATFAFHVAMNWNEKRKTEIRRSGK